MWLCWPEGQYYHMLFQWAVETRLPRPCSADAGCSIDVQLFLQPDQTRLHSQVSEHSNGTSKSTLRVMQGNAESLSTKVQGLRSWLATESINVCLGQQTKLADSPTTNHVGDLISLLKSHSSPTCHYRLQPTLGKTHHTNPAHPTKMRDVLYIPCIHKRCQ